MRIAGDVATGMVRTGSAPRTGEDVDTAGHLRDREPRPRLLRFFKREDDFEVRDVLIPANLTEAALPARIGKANRSVTEGRYMHTIPRPFALEQARVRRIAPRPPDGPTPAPEAPVAMSCGLRRNDA